MPLRLTDLLLQRYRRPRGLRSHRGARSATTGRPKGGPSLRARTKLKWVTNPAGVTYYVYNVECDCPDKLARGGSYQGRCKHELWIGQLRPCEICCGTMALGEFKTCFGEVLKRFECPDCGNARDFGLVRAERRANRYGAEVPGRLVFAGRQVTNNRPRGEPSVNSR